jgi:hypothetical protein
MNTKPNILIFSMYKTNESVDTNINRHKYAIKVLLRYKVSFSEVIGYYNNKSEQSIIVHGFEHRELIEMLCDYSNQDCYLESHNDRSTFLVYPDERREYIGVLKPVSQRDAEKSGNYTYHPYLNQYYKAV